MFNVTSNTEVFRMRLDFGDNDIRFVNIQDKVINLTKTYRTPEITNLTAIIMNNSLSIYQVMNSKNEFILKSKLNFLNFFSLKRSLRCKYYLPRYPSSYQLRI